MQIEKGIPGLKQAGDIDNDKLKAHTRTHSYTPVTRTPALWKHKTRLTIFTLVVDDLEIRYSSLHDANYLIHTLKEL